MERKGMTIRQLLEERLGAEKTARFVRGLKEAYRYGKYYGEFYFPTTVKNTFRGRGSEPGEVVP